MRNQHIIIIAGTLLFVLAGCFDSSGGGGTSSDSTDSAVATIFATSIVSDSASISDPNALAISIDNLFGAENAEPISINAGDTIADVLDRATNG